MPDYTNSLAVELETGEMEEEELVDDWSDDLYDEANNN